MIIFNETSLHVLVHVSLIFSLIHVICKMATQQFLDEIQCWSAFCLNSMLKNGCRYKAPQYSFLMWKL